MPLGGVCRDEPRSGATLVAFAGFAIRLQAIARLLQKLAHYRVADLMSFVRQLFAQLPQTARRPQQGLHRIAARCRINQSLEIPHKRRIINDLRLAPSAALADAPHTGFVASANIIQSAINSPSRKAGDANHTTDARKVKKQKRPTDQSVRRLRLAVRSVAR